MNPNEVYMLARKYGLKSLLDRLQKYSNIDYISELYVLDELLSKLEQIEKIVCPECKRKIFNN